MSSKERKIFKKTYKEANNNLKDFVLDLSLAQNKMKQLNDQLLLCKGDIILATNKIEIEEMNFVVSIIGFIDYKLDEIKRVLKSSSITEEEIPKYDELYKKYSNARKSFVNDYISFINNLDNVEENYTKNLLIEAISIQPSYLYFGELYNDLNNNFYDYMPQVNFVSAYNKGYLSGANISDYKFIYDVYDMLCHDFEKHKIKSIQKIIY